MHSQERATIISFVDRSFRDMADGDYICARTSHRLRLEQQFLWASLQAIEKYLKGILLYNDKSVKGIGHKVKTAYHRLQSISDIAFEIPTDVERFIEYLDEFGVNRYFEFPYYTIGNELLLLDKAVWHIRRYCRSFDREPIKLGGKITSWFEIEIRQIHSQLYKDNPHRLQVAGGLLEELLRQKRSPARVELVWKNFYYGTNRKHRRSFTFRSSSANPTHYLHPDVFKELQKRVPFSKEVVAFFQNKGPASP